MENQVFNSIINASRIDVVDNHKYLCELIEILDKNINEEVDRKIVPINLEINQFQNQFREIHNDNTSELIRDLIISSIEDVKASYNSWGNIIWSSLFLSIYGNFESRINRICLIIMGNDNIELSPKDLRGSGLTRARNYLCKVAKYKFSISDDKWKLSEIYNKIRNIIIHNEGRLVKLNEKYKDIDLYKFINSHPHLIIDKLDRITITRDFVLETEFLWHNIYLTICDDLVGL